MNQGILTGEEFNVYLSNIYLDEQKKYISERLLELTKDEQQLVVELLKNIFPEKSNLINESKWYNILGDIAGFFDPTGVIDIINGISYFKQGDTFYGILSFIAALPGMDIITKPIIAASKVSKGAKLFRTATIAGDATKMGKIGLKSVIFGKLLNMVGNWGGKLLKIIPGFLRKNKVLGWLIDKLKNVINLFTKARNNMGKLGKIPDIYSRNKRVQGNIKNIKTTNNVPIMASNNDDPISSVFSSLFG